MTSKSQRPEETGYLIQLSNNLFPSCCPQIVDSCRCLYSCLLMNCVLISLHMLNCVCWKCVLYNICSNYFTYFTIYEVRPIASSKAKVYCMKWGWKWQVMPANLIQENNWGSISPCIHCICDTIYKSCIYTVQSLAPVWTKR